MSTACRRPTSAAACHGDRSSAAAKKTAAATLIFSLRLTWRGNSRARMPAAAIATISHQSKRASSRPSVAAKIATAARPTASR
jgi:hypothetical protein